MQDIYAKYCIHNGKTELSCSTFDVSLLGMVCLFMTGSGINSHFNWDLTHHVCKQTSFIKILINNITKREGDV